MDFYNNAALALDRLAARKGSLKGIVFDLARKTHPKKTKSDDARSISDGKRLMKVTIEVLKYREVLQAILERTDLLEKEKKAFTSPSHWQHPSPLSLATVLLHDHLFAKRGIALSKQHKLRQAVEKHAGVLHAAKEREKLRRGVSSDAELAIDTSSSGKGKQKESGDEGDPAVDGKPRWLRINTLLWTVDAAKTWLASHGYAEARSFSELLDASADACLFSVDPHIDALLALPSKVDLEKLQPYTDGRLIAQDKASCFPAALLLSDIALLGAGERFDVIDATAAPGNKTTMLSALLGQRGTVWAFERDPKRFETLKTMVAKARCKNVKCIKGDFLKAKHDDPRFSNVRRILLDPSCSGSGIVSRLDHLHSTSSHSPSDRDLSRILALSRFQSLILRHALAFPDVQEVAYSTCSVWKEEDEDVVKGILEREGVKDRSWRVKEVAGGLSDWTRRGRPTDGLLDQATNNMIRADPRLDPTIGFFAVVFTRDQLGNVRTDVPDVAAQSMQAQLAVAPGIGLLSPPASDEEDEPVPMRPSPHLDVADERPSRRPALEDTPHKKRRRLRGVTAGKVAKNRRRLDWVRPGRIVRA